MREIKSMIRGKRFGPTGATKLELTDNGRAIKGLVVCGWFGPMLLSTVSPKVCFLRLKLKFFKYISVYTCVVFKMNCLLYPIMNQIYILLRSSHITYKFFMQCVYVICTYSLNVSNKLKALE